MQTGKGKTGRKKKEVREMKTNQEDQNQKVLNMERTKRTGKETDKKFTIKDIVYIGVFAAIISVCALITIPTPWGVPFTLHTFAVALSAYCMGKWKGSLATTIWMLIGLVGVPVYSGFTAGPAKLFGPTGGYIWSFILMTFCCGIALNKQKKWLTVVFSILGLAVCYICGMLQFMLIMHMGMAEAFFLTIAPYMVKDIVSIFAAYGIAIPIRKVMLQNQLEQAL